MKRTLSVLLSVIVIWLLLPTPAQATTYGWKWRETIEVYDATKGYRHTQVREAVREWDRSDARVVMTNNRAAANIVVETRSTLNATGTAFLPTITNGTATGRCYATLKPSAASQPYAEAVVLHEIGHCLGLAHSPDGVSSIMTSIIWPTTFLRQPTSYDYADLNRLY